MASIQTIYKKRYESSLLSIAEKLELDLKDNLKDVNNIDRISARAKSIDRFLKKAKKKEGGKYKYDDPINQIQDQIGARIITFYLKDVEAISEKIQSYYKPIERKDIISESENEFGYVGKHFILLIPSDVKPDGIAKDLIPNFFELQIKTLFQHAFSEASHDLAYKPSVELSKEQKRKVAFTAAQAWGADLILSDLSNELINY